MGKERKRIWFKRKFKHKKTGKIIKTRDIWSLDENEYTPLDFWGDEEFWTLLYDKYGYPDHYVTIE